jgi:hypothetical protein
VDGLQGLVLDGMGSVGPELITNGDFSAGGTGWATNQPTSGSVSISGGAATINTLDGSYASITQGNVMAGTTYYYEITVVSSTGTGVIIALGGSQRTSPMSTPGVHSGYLTATITAAIEVKRPGAGHITNTVIGNISLKLVSGIHATASGAARPTLRRGAVNLLTYSQDFANAAWVKGDLGASSWSFVAGVQDPFGGTSAFTASLSGSRFFRQSSVPTIAGATYTQAVWIRSSASGGAANIRLTTNNVTAWNTGYSTKVALSNSWQLLVTSGVVQTGNTLAHIMFGTADATGTLDASCYGNIDVYSASLFQGTLTAQQILNEGGIPLTTTTAASNPSAGRYSWQFAGAQSMALGSVPFAMTDSFFVCFGASWDTVAAGDRPVIGFRSGTAMIRIGSSASSLDAFLRDDASTLSRLFIASQVAAGTPLVAGFSREGAVNTFYKNDAQIGTDSTVLGTATITQWDIGKDVVGGGFHSGTTGPIVLINGTLTRAQKTTISRFVASLTPNGPTF